jgi:hypothetical protein
MHAGVCRHWVEEGTDSYDDAGLEAFFEAAFALEAADLEVADLGKTKPGEGGCAWSCAKDLSMFFSPLSA